MSNKKKSFSTVIVTGKDHSQTRFFNIKTKYLKYWKTYLFSLVLLICLLFSAVIGLFLYVQTQEDRANNLEVQVINLKNSHLPKVEKVVPKIDDTVQTRTYINQIQDKLKGISEYLHKRGVRGFSSSSVGGGGGKKNDQQLSINKKLELYDEYIHTLFSSLKSTPLGYPHHGNVSSAYGYRPDPFESSRTDFHGGIDIRGKTGEKVRSTANGKVICASWLQGYGNCVRIVHANGYQTLYGHFSKIKVRDGQAVHAGDVIGYIGSTGNSTGPHLHYEVRLNNKPINPKKFLSL